MVDLFPPAPGTIGRTSPYSRVDEDIVDMLLDLWNPPLIPVALMPSPGGGPDLMLIAASEPPTGKAPVRQQ